MLITVCIPAYNRSKLLPDLLDSIVGQVGAEFEILICEDASPERELIRRVVYEYIKIEPCKIRYYENSINLGYDGNLRQLIELARGEYIFFMGNDDLMAAGALAAVATAVQANPSVGVVLRSYSSFISSPDKPVQIFRYFDKNSFFPAGPLSIATFFRRCVFISGLVLRRDSALELSTNRFDGSLLYQQYLVGNILAKENGIYLTDILSYHRLGGVPDFGNSEAEKGLFVPKMQTPQSSINFMKGMLLIAKSIEIETGLRVYKKILFDLGNYIYPVLAIQADKRRFVLINYMLKLMALGFWRVPNFYVYSVGLLIFGKNWCDKLISLIKIRLGRAPFIGQVYSGES